MAEGCFRLFLDIIAYAEQYNEWLENKEKVCVSRTMKKRKVIFSVKAAPSCTARRVYAKVEHWKMLVMVSKILDWDS